MILSVDLFIYFPGLFPAADICDDESQAAEDSLDDPPDKNCSVSVDVFIS